LNASVGAENTYKSASGIEEGFASLY